MKENSFTYGRSEFGFTLLEMLISMAIGLVILAGLTSIFIANSETSRVISSRTEQMGDLFLASHLMQEALRESQSAPDPTTSILTNLTARNVSKPSQYPTSDTTFTALPFWHAASKTITYQDVDGNVGIFHYQHTKTDRIYWLRPLAVGVSGTKNFQELMRDLDPANGLTVYNPTANPKAPVGTVLGGGMEVKLQSQYTNKNHQTSYLSLGLMIWPRN